MPASSKGKNAAGDASVDTEENQPAEDSAPAEEPSADKPVGRSAPKKPAAKKPAGGKRPRKPKREPEPEPEPEAEQEPDAEEPTEEPEELRDDELDKDRLEEEDENLEEEDENLEDENLEDEDEEPSRRSRPKIRPASRPASRSRTASRPSSRRPAPRTRAAGPPKPRRPVKPAKRSFFADNRLRIIAGAVALVVLGALTANVLLWMRSNDLQAEKDNRQAVSTRASEFVTLLLSNDYQDVSGYKSRLKQRMASEFSSQLEEMLSPQMEQAIVGLQMKSEATVHNVFLGDVSEDKAEAVVVADTEVTRKDRIVRQRGVYLQVGLVFEKGQWLVENANQVTIVNQESFDPETGKPIEDGASPSEDGSGDQPDSKDGK